MFRKSLVALIALFCTSSAFAQDIVVTMSPLSPPAGVVSPGQSDVRVMDVQVTSRAVPIAIKAIGLRRWGLSYDSSVVVEGSYLVLEPSYHDLGGGGNFVGGVLRSVFSEPLVINEGVTAEIEVAVDVTESASGGETFGIELVPELCEFVYTDFVTPFPGGWVSFADDLRSEMFGVVAVDFPPIPTVGTTVSTITLTGTVIFDGAFRETFVGFTALATPFFPTEIRVGDEVWIVTEPGYDVQGGVGPFVVPASGLIELPEITIRQGSLNHPLRAGMQLLSLPMRPMASIGIPPYGGFAVYQKSDGLLETVRAQERVISEGTFQLPDLNSQAGAVLVFAPNGGEVVTVYPSPLGWGADGTLVKVHKGVINLLGVPTIDASFGIYLPSAFEFLLRVGVEPVVVLALNTKGQWHAVGGSFFTSTDPKDLVAPIWSGWIAIVNKEGFIDLSECLYPIGDQPVAATAARVSREVIAASVIVPTMIGKAQLAQLEKYAPLSTLPEVSYDEQSELATVWGRLRVAR